YPHSRSSLRFTFSVVPTIYVSITTSALVYHTSVSTTAPMFNHSAPCLKDSSCPSSDHPLADSSCSTTTTTFPHHSIHLMVTRLHNNIVKEKQYTNGDALYPLPQAMLATSSLDEIEPTCYSSAATHPSW
ncbi:unnamed protein product, partial [Ilex paraguariensis]